MNTLIKSDMRYIITNIEYDTDGEEVDLPETLTVDIPNDDFVKMDEEEVDEYISNDISDQTGFCHKGYSIVGE